MKRSRALRFAALAALGLAMQPAWTQDDPESWIKYRQGSMKALGGHMAASAQLVRGKVAVEGHLTMHAQAIADITRDLLALFPEGSDFGETDAKESIWSEWDRFQELAEDSARAADELLQTVNAGDGGATGEAFKALGETCKACHKDFRLEEE